VTRMIGDEIILGRIRSEPAHSLARRHVFPRLSSS
jgi:hypothetical protein